MEESILKTYNYYLYQDKIDELYNSNSEDFPYPVDLEVKTSFKTIYNFNKDYFHHFEETLLVNSIIYAIENNLEKFIDIVESNINNIKEVINNDLLFQAKITEYALKNIISKSKIEDNKFKFINTNSTTINKYPELFKKISNNYIKYNTILDFYRTILFGFIDNLKDDIEDTELLIDELITTKKYDDMFLTYADGIIDKNSLDYFKYIMVLMILSDNYVLAEATINESSPDRIYNENIEENSFVLESKEIIEYIEQITSIEEYKLPDDEDFRYIFIANFLDYNDGNKKEKSKDIKSIEEDEEKSLKLKKINPFYKLDLLG